MKDVIVILLLLFVPVVLTKLLPLFPDLKMWYPGYASYGGVFSDPRVIKNLNLSSHPSIKINSDTCILRMSTALNLNRGHEVRESYNGSAKGLKGLYYFYERKAFLDYLKEVYGRPLTSNTTETFKSQVGIMFIDATVSKNSSDVCKVLLWNGVGFHQARGFVQDIQSVKKFELWPTTTGDCNVNLNIKQSTCFPSKSKVELKSGKKIPMSEVGIGDLVKTYSKKGEVMFSPVVTFLDQMPDYKGHYYTITTACNFQITLSEAHLIFKTIPMPHFTNCSAHASQVRPGDFILVHTRRGRYPELVTSVSIAEMQGAFAPVTEEGTMIVDDVWVSCYADIADHDLADTLMTPLKRFYGLAPHVLGTGGKYVHGYMKGALRPIGVRIFGKEKFYQSPQREVLRVEETSIESFFKEDNK